MGSTRTSDAALIVWRDIYGRPILKQRKDQGMQVYGPLELLGGLVVGGSGAGVEGVVNSFEYVDDVLISKASIIGTTAGLFGHAAGFPLVADPGADKCVELVSALMVSDRAVAAYTDGGNITVNENGGAALTGLVSAANSLGAATDKVAIFKPLTTAARVVTVNKGLNLVTSAAFTDPGTAAGVVRVRVRYAVHTLLLT